MLVGLYAESRSALEQILNSLLRPGNDRRPSQLRDWRVTFFFDDETVLIPIHLE